MTSGAIQGTEPETARIDSSRVFEQRPRSCFEQPKSASLATPCSFTSTFAPLMSRWMIPFPWR